MQMAARCMPARPNSIGRSRRTPSSGTRSPCCGSTGATAIAALVTHGLSGIDALITHVATGTGLDPEFGRRLRGWSQQQWDDAVDSLRTRDLLDDAGQLTATGNELRTSIEDLTDELAHAPWQTVSDDDAQELVALGEIIRDGVRAAGVFPTNAFGPRYGQHRSS